jgi:hypothetical protein
VSLDEHLQELDRAIAEIAQTQLEDAQLTTLDAIALVKLRLASGENKDGNQFSDYSTLYAQKRAAKGLQTGVKDFNVTGRLYSSILPEVESVEVGKVVVAIVPKGVDSQNKVKGQIKRDGLIITPSANEIADITDAYSRRRSARINNLLNK